MTRLNALSAHEMIAGYEAGRFSPVDVTTAVLEHIERCEPQLNALWFVDAEGALETARASQARWQAGTPIRVRGVSLDGIPITLKENIATKGVPMPLGTASGDMTPKLADSPPAARLREAGAVFLGRTTMPDFGMASSGTSSFHKLARNPWNLEKNPGGSSAGAAAAGAAGYGPIHLGTDIGGSVRLPAAWCGLVGHKPSLGRIPIQPPFMGRVAGPMTRNVQDCAMAMAILSQPDCRDHMSLPDVAIDWLDLERSVSGLKIGLLVDPGCGMAVDPQVKRAVEMAAAVFADAGAHVEPLKPWMTPEMLYGLDHFWRTRSGIDVQALPEHTRDKILPIMREWAESGLGKTGEEVFRNYMMTLEIREKTVAATADFDFVLTPTSPNVSFPAHWTYPNGNSVEHAQSHINFTLLFNMSEQPAVSVPCGYDLDGVPIGLQIAGRRFDDLGVLQIARAWERMQTVTRPWPMG
ncbi:amidase [Brucella pseudogrignonensis]|uniref:amidase n=1 Tax=Brucella pseudogrignonensis TaxID=419475 RepID=UPI00190A97E0|nr:amidase [Brucella pseudogrignonensis]MBK0022489.1 amidase [Ochrobactrum sp. S45]MBK0044504.1 amidase [Ochrobactrum sp. S46]MCD4513818.1 amidase [Brucella pseudogrignonensis]UKK95438.1 amidase [Brucella pseudogrignonensis]